MSEFKITGKLVYKGEMERKGKDGNFLTQEFAIELEGRYPEYPCFQLTQDRCALIDRFQPGDMITVHFDLRGREWQGKYFTNLNAWRITPADGEPHEASQPPADIDWNAPVPEVAAGASSGPSNAEDTDLHF